MITQEQLDAARAVCETAEPNAELTELFQSVRDTGITFNQFRDVRHTVLSEKAESGLAAAVAELPGGMTEELAYQALRPRFPMARRNAFRDAFNENYDLKSDKPKSDGGTDVSEDRGDE